MTYRQKQEPCLGTEKIGQLKYAAFFSIIKPNSHMFCGWFKWIWLFLFCLCCSYMADGFLSVGTAITIGSIVLMSFFVGDLFIRFALNNSERFNNVSTRLLIGSLLSSFSLYVLALSLPFGLTIDWIVLFIATLLIWGAVRNKNKAIVVVRANISECVFLVLATIATIVWCQDMLRPLEATGNIAILRIWPDVYYHLSEIAVLAKSVGLSSMSDNQMAGVPVHPYHFASYILPALILHTGNISAITSFAGFLGPFGILLTALAAYCLAFSVFGEWPGLMAGLSVLLLPDAYQQGFGNQLMGGYYWLQQSAPGGSYGVASAAVVFMLMFEAYRTENFKAVAFAYLFLLITLTFKAHIFVAISFLAVVSPALIWRTSNNKYRIAFAVLLSGIYFLVVRLSQFSLSVPTLRLDGTGLSFYSTLAMGGQVDGVIHDIGVWALALAGEHWTLKAFVFSLFVIITTFGFVSFIYATCAYRLRKFHSRVVLLFPVAV